MTKLEERVEEFEKWCEENNIGLNSLLENIFGIVPKELKYDPCFIPDKLLDEIARYELELFNEKK